MDPSSSAICRAAPSTKCRAACFASSSEPRRCERMRIVGGKHRGRRIAAPPGDTVRPTSERAREALFNILAHGRFATAPVFEDARVLDVFAGTGAFGLEALSRGARFATFIEKDRQAREALAANIKALG